LNVDREKFLLGFIGIEGSNDDIDAILIVLVRSAFKFDASAFEDGSCDLGRVKIFICLGRVKVDLKEGVGKLFTGQIVIESDSKTSLSDVSTVVCGLEEDGRLLCLGVGTAKGDVTIVIAMEIEVFTCEIKLSAFVKETDEVAVKRCNNVVRHLLIVNELVDVLLGELKVPRFDQQSSEF